jgi:hypothetical protein
MGKIKKYLHEICDLYDLETILPALGGTICSLTGMGGSIDYVVKR